MFYDEYFKLDVTEATKYKLDYLKSILKKNRIYKFIAFNDDNKLNEIKLQCLKNDSLWFSYFRYLNDPTEFDISYNRAKVSSALGVTDVFIDYFIKTIIEIYDVCSFTYLYEDYMWSEYANDSSGICLEFKAHNLDKLYPVEYKPKKDIDFDGMIIKSFKQANKLFNERNGQLYNDPLSLYPWVVKNPQNGHLDSTKEKEIRILYSPYEFSEFNNGIINEGIKDIMNFHGLNVEYTQVNLTLEKIVVGSKCIPELVEKIKEICTEKDIAWTYQNFTR